MTSLNQLHSLFWLDEQPPSDRLWDSRPPLTRIWSLTINIKDVNERFRPGAYIDVEPDYDRYPDDPYARSEDGWSVDNEDCSGTKRLLREPWVLPHLTYISDASICTGDGGEDSLLGFFVSRVFPHLDPRQFILRSAPSKTWADHVLMEVQRAFVHNWDALTCIEMDGLSLSACAPGDHDDDDGLDRQACPIWGQDHDSLAGERKLELVFDFTSRTAEFDRLQIGPYREMLFLFDVLERGGVTREAMENVDLGVVCKIKPADARVVQEEVAELDEWTRGILVIKADAPAAAAR